MCSGEQESVVEQKDSIFFNYYLFLSNMFQQLYEKLDDLFQKKENTKGNKQSKDEKS